MPAAGGFFAGRRRIFVEPEAPTVWGADERFGGMWVPQSTCR
jgi:hypothetical protein